MEAQISIEEIRAEEIRKNDYNSTFVKNEGKFVDLAENEK